MDCPIYESIVMCFGVQCIISMKDRLLFPTCALLMLLLGASDALRGIFSPLFIGTFGYSTGQVGLIVSASYLGNLVCLLSGGILLDKIGIKKSFMLFILIMMLSEILLLFGYKFPLLVSGFFVSLGVSTLLNTTINLISDRFSNDKPMTYLNMLFFLQGIGTSGSQFILSRYSSSWRAWNLTLITIALLLIPVMILIRQCGNIERKRVDQDCAFEENDEKKPCMTKLAFITLALAFYLIAEHGVTNYFMIYGTQHLALSPSYAGNALASFSIGIMLGRLVFGLAMTRIGEKRMLLLSLLFCSIFYIAVYVFSLSALLFFAGLACAIVYPTLTASVRSFVPSFMGARATTMVIAAASIFDVVFNFVFGYMISILGYRISMYFLPLCMVLALLSLLMARLHK